MIVLAPSSDSSRLRMFRL